jgi:site-specific recombinase XerD
MRYVSNHAWRHLYASSLIENGIDVKTVQHCMGHSSSQITLDLYCHVFQSYQTKALGVVASLWTVDNDKLADMDGEAV